MANKRKDYLHDARKMSETGSLSESFNAYLQEFEINPASKHLCELEFRVVLTKLNEVLAQLGKIEVIFENFRHATKAYPNNAYVMNEVGKYLYKYGFYLEAWGHFQKALTLDSGFVNAEKNLNSVKNLLVERWHFRMINDRIRNEAYQAAITHSMKHSEDSVLDIGTGTGLLSLYASEHKSATVIACDGCEIMTELAIEILKENDRPLVQVLNKMSTSLLPNDIGGLKSLVVTELFDAGLFGEHVLPALAHAWDNLLLTDIGRVIPCRAELYIIGAKCDSLIMKYQLSRSCKERLNILHLNVHTLAHDETYDCDDVYLYKDLKYITNAQKLLDVDFNNYNDIQDKMICCDPFNVNLKCLEDGELNVFFGWFKLYLTENIVITTDPTSENKATAWQQAVFFDNDPQTVVKNQTINASFLINEDRLTMQCSHIGQVVRTSPEIIRFLNDSELMHTIAEVIPEACEYLAQLGECSQMDIADLCPFPILGLHLMKRGMRSLVCCARSDDDKLFIEQVFQANEIPLSKIKILTEEWDIDSFIDETYHCICCNILELCGDIDVNMRQLADDLKEFNLEDDGLFLPSKVTLMGQFISSHWLEVNNRVHDENASGYRIAKHFNKYQVSQNFCIDYSQLEFVPLSDIHTLAELTGEMTPVVLNIPITFSGDCSAILCWFKVQLWNDYEVVTNRASSFVDSIAFLAKKSISMCEGDIGNILRCVDSDGHFKLLMDLDV